MDHGRITQQRAIELFNYDPNTGVFIRKIRTSRREFVGSVAGSVDSKGYVIMSVDNKRIKAHRLAWLFVHGYIPENLIDHIDKNKSNNKINNLREISHSCNLANSRVAIDNTSGVKGVCYNKRKSVWISYISVNKKNYRLGMYKTIEEAIFARFAGEQAVSWNSCEIESSARSYVKQKLSGGTNASC